jgi:hypothetical protein
VLTIDTSQPLDVDAIARRVRSQIERHT